MTRHPAAVIPVRIREEGTPVGAALAVLGLASTLAMATASCGSAPSSAAGPQPLEPSDLDPTVSMAIDGADGSAPAQRDPRILVYSRTTGFRHGSIPAGIGALEAIGSAAGFTVEASEDPARFNDGTLASYAAIVFLNTTGDVLNDAQQAAFERYIQAGGGFVGVHSATDTEYDWPWYGGLVGTYFARHPAVQEATIDVVDGEHPSTQHLDQRWVRRDEWYDFREDPSPWVSVLLTVDEGSYDGGGMGAPHAIAWYRRYDGGRSWYTAMGHTVQSYAEPEFRAHLQGGILWSAGLVEEPTTWRVYLPRLERAAPAGAHAQE